MKQIRLISSFIRVRFTSIVNFYFASIICVRQLIRPLSGPVERYEICVRLAEQASGWRKLLIEELEALKVLLHPVVYSR
jgi:hypothetical protein